MIENIDENGILPTSTCMQALDLIVYEAQCQALGWAYAEMCTLLDRGTDPRTAEVPELLKCFNRDLVLRNPGAMPSKQKNNASYT